jgi:hypothetical protein
MKPARVTILFLLLLLMLLPLRLAGAAAAPSARDKENYERLLAIILTGSDENQKVARQSLLDMGDVGIALLSDDCKDIESVRGALAWSLLRDELADSNGEFLREFARKDLVDVAKDWNLAYTKGAVDKIRQQSLGAIVIDFVNLLALSPKPADFDLLLKSLKFSLLTTAGPKADFGAEFNVWQKIWFLLADKVKATDSVKDLDAWQKIIDDHFRAYSLQKDFVGTKAIQAYQSATLLLMARTKALQP